MQSCLPYRQRGLLLLSSPTRRTPHRGAQRSALLCRVGADRDEQAAGGLRIKEQVAMFRRHRGSKLGALAHEFAVILQPTRNLTSFRCFERARQERKRGVIDIN